MAALPFTGTVEETTTIVEEGLVIATGETVIVSVTVSGSFVVLELEDTIDAS